MKIAILGSTGSVGSQTLEVIQAFPEEFEVIALSANQQIDRLLEQIQIFQPRFVTIGTEVLANELRQRVDDPKLQILVGTKGLCQMASMDEVDLVVTSVVGMIGLEPTLAAIRAKKTIALANKETLVTAGKLVMSEAKKYGVDIIPIDSEHSAIYQALACGSHEEVERLILTASGGPFRGKSTEDLGHVTFREALKHPNWSMGKKITIDSATLMNKGLEVIEAFWLFDLPIKQISVLVHPQSIVHSMVEYCDGNVLAQLGPSDMRLPIQFALSMPKRLITPWPRLNFLEHSALTFEALDHETFPCFDLCIQAIQKGGTFPTVLNAANEVAVHAFLHDEIRFTEIPLLIAEVLNQHESLNEMNLNDILLADQWARKIANQILERG
jgi:1-deoxy-D-xylulose-5-phosphate reductoisomerase